MTLFRWHVNKISKKNPNSIFVLNLTLYQTNEDLYVVVVFGIFAIPSAAAAVANAAFGCCIFLLSCQYPFNIFMWSCISHLDLVLRSTASIELSSCWHGFVLEKFVFGIFPFLIQ